LKVLLKFSVISAYVATSRRTLSGMNVGGTATLVISTGIVPSERITKNSVSPQMLTHLLLSCYY